MRPTGASIEPWQPLGQAPPHLERAATERDTAYWRASLLALALTTPGVVAWAAGLFGDGLMLRLVLGAPAAFTMDSIGWQWPHVGAAAAEPPTEPEQGGVTIRVSFAPTVFWSSWFRVHIMDPRLAYLVERSRE